MSATTLGAAKEPIRDFGARFVAEAVRLGVPLSSEQAKRLGAASKGQIMCAVEKRLPSLNPELLRLLSRRGPEELAREISRPGVPEKGMASGAMDVIDAGNLIEFLASVVSEVIVAVDCP